MKKIIPSLFCILLFVCSCSENNSSSENATQTDSSVVAIDTTIQSATKPSEISSVKLTYEEITIDGGSLSQEEDLKNGESLFLNGCSTFKLKKLSVKGSGTNLTLVINNSGAPFKRTGIDLSQEIIITNKEVSGDISAATRIEILEGEKQIFKFSFDMSGCN